MAYTLTSVVTEIQAKIKDTTLPVSLILMYLQDTLDEVLGHNIFLFSEETLSDTISAGSLDYTFSADVQTITDLSFVTVASPTQTYRPTYIPYRKFLQLYPNRLTSAAGIPLYFTRYGNKILWPTAISEDLSMTCLYVKASPTLANDTDVQIIPVEFKQILVRGALAGVEEYRENYDIAAVHKRKVEDLVEDMLGRYGGRQLISTAKSTLSRRRNGQESPWV